MEQRGQNENMAGHLPTSLKGLDNALCGGLPFGVVTELVGPAGIGKTQVWLSVSNLKGNVFSGLLSYLVAVGTLGFLEFLQFYLLCLQVYVLRHFHTFYQQLVYLPIIVVCFLVIKKIVLCVSLLLNCLFCHWYVFFTELILLLIAVLLEAFVTSFSSFELWRLRWFRSLYRYRIQI